MNGDTPQLRVAALKALLDYVDEVYEAARAELTGELVKDYKSMGADRRAVLLPDGTKVALTSLTVPHESCTVSSDGERDYRDYVRELWPDQIELIPSTARVRTAFRKAHLASLEIKDGYAIEPSTGEIVPGVVVMNASDPSGFSLRSAHEGREAIAKAWRSGLLADLLDFPPAAVEPADPEFGLRTDPEEAAP